MKMKIPDTLKIVGRTISIVWQPDLIQNDDDNGQAHFRKDAITLQPSTQGFPRSQQSISITLLHEILHWILFLTHEDQAIQDNEPLIHRLSEVLYQTLHDNQLRF
jgi:predicted SprT family Zn-dependent metalloprotease